LQWLDAATLDLIEHLVTHPEVRRLLLSAPTGTTRSAPRTASAHAGGNPQSRSAGRGDRAGALELDDVGRSSPTPCVAEPERGAALSATGAGEDGGNPFFAIQFFTALAKRRLLAFSTRTAGLA